ncbi:MAG: Shedu anti-phage system protein SduA domain-containing protein [Kiloniellaceae bacterium]
MPIASLDVIARYLASYLEAYRQEYASFVSPAPHGGGYPPLPVSPYLYTSRLLCFVARDGYAVADFSREPEYRWEIAGGPALLPDFPESRTPGEIVSLLKAQGIWGKPIGLYRLVAKGGIPDEVWRGDLGRLTALTELSSGGTTIQVEQRDIDWRSLVQRLTFGAYDLILDVKLPDPQSPFWRPHITRDLGFAPADRSNRRFCHYLELSPHLDEAAWDERSIPIRVAVDLRRDFAQAFAMQPHGQGGTISFGAPTLWIERFHDRLRLLAEKIAQFAALLAETPDADEAVFHTFLQETPILLDVYGDVRSKPKFVYPPGASPLGKEYVEPDFVVRYIGNSYKLVEIERPSKALGTGHGEARAGVTQAAFQIAEWKTYIQKHYDLISGEFPGIAVDNRTMILISRSREESVGHGRRVDEYLELVKNQLAVDEVLTYDYLLQRAEAAYARLAALAPAAT